jgi:hypothetical protein
MTGWRRRTREVRLRYKYPMFPQPSPNPYGALAGHIHVLDDNPKFILYTPRPPSLSMQIAFRDKSSRYLRQLYPTKSAQSAPPDLTNIGPPKLSIISPSNQLMSHLSVSTNGELPNRSTPSSRANPRQVSVSSARISYYLNQPYQTKKMTPFDHPPNPRLLIGPTFRQRRFITCNKSSSSASYTGRLWVAISPFPARVLLEYKYYAGHRLQNDLKATQKVKSTQFVKVN